jgi:hypothetical protein
MVISQHKRWAVRRDRFYIKKHNKCTIVFLEIRGKSRCSVDCLTFRRETWVPESTFDTNYFPEGNEINLLYTKYSHPEMVTVNKKSVFSLSSGKCFFGLSQGCQMIFFSDQKSQFGSTLEGLANMSCIPILWPFGLFYCHLIYFTASWYNWCQFGTFFPVLVCCIKKNLATLSCHRNKTTAKYFQ